MTYKIEETETKGYGLKKVEKVVEGDTNTEVSNKVPTGTIVTAPPIDSYIFHNEAKSGSIEVTKYATDGGEWLNDSNNTDKEDEFEYTITLTPPEGETVIDTSGITASKIDVNAASGTEPTSVTITWTKTEDHFTGKFKLNITRKSP